MSRPRSESMKAQVIFRLWGRINNTPSQQSAARHSRADTGHTALALAQPSTATLDAKVKATTPGLAAATPPIFAPTAALAKAKARFKSKSKTTASVAATQPLKHAQLTPPLDFDAEKVYASVLAAAGLDVDPHRTFTCPVCFDDAVPVAKGSRISWCGHEVCDECLRTYVGVKLGERQYPIVCPVCAASAVRAGVKRTVSFGCITNRLVDFLVLSEEQADQYEELQKARFSVRIDCQGCHRPSYVDRKEHEAETGFIATCRLPECGHRWCKKCKEAVELGAAHSCLWDIEFEKLLKVSKWQRCPACSSAIERISGCNRMVCTAAGCNTSFCYACGCRQTLCTGH